MQLEPDDEGAMEISDDDAWDSDDSKEDDGPPIPALQPHPRDLDNFMLLCRALRLFLSDEMTPTQVDQADTLLCQYCGGLLEVCLTHSISMPYVLTYLVLVVRSVRNQTKPPLCDAHRRLRVELRPSEGILDVCL